MQKSVNNESTISMLAIILLLFVLHPMQSMAGTDTTAAATKDMQKISMQDYNTMAEFTAVYDQCLQHTARSNLTNYHDPRQVLDFAMKECAAKLDALNNWFIAENFSLNFRKHYIKRSIRKSVSQAMPKIMAQMAN